MKRDRSIGPPEGPRDRDEEFAGYMWARQPALLRTAYLLTGDQAAAADLVRLALAELYLSWDSVHAHADLDALVRRLVVRRHCAARRRARRHRVDVPPEPSGTAPVWTRVQALPRKQRTIAVLRHYEGLDDAEIAAALGTSIRAVRKLAIRAQDALRPRADEVLT